MSESFQDCTGLRTEYVVKFKEDWPGAEVVKRGQRVRVDHKGLITIHAGLLFTWRLEMKSMKMTLSFLCHRSKSYYRIV